MNNLQISFKNTYNITDNTQIKINTFNCIQYDRLVSDAIYQ